jgi:hypothetical protein
VKDFVINRPGRLVFPSNAWPRLDFSVFETVGQLSAVVSRDFEAKAPSASLIVSRLEAGGYPSRYEFLRDLGLHAFWVNRFAITMYDKRPTRWRDAPRDRGDVFLPLLTPWPGFERTAGIIASAFRALPPSWDEQIEQKISERHRPVDRARASVSLVTSARTNVPTPASASSFPPRPRWCRPARALRRPHAAGWRPPGPAPTRRR